MSADFGKATARTIKGFIGDKIESLTLDARGDEKIVLRFANDSLVLWDNAQTCCEYRHTSTEDDLTKAAGSKLLAVELREAPDIDDGGECHEVQFLDIVTTKGRFQFVNHNEHNGYYGGFRVVASAE